MRYLTIPEEIAPMSDEGIYASYCAYCESVGVLPLGYESWRGLSNRIRPVDELVFQQFHGRSCAPGNWNGSWDNVVRTLEEQE